MASVRENGRDGHEKTYSVLFRQNKKQRSKTFETLEAAEGFRNSIELVGVERALKYLIDEEPRQAGMSLDELAGMWLAAKEGAVTPYIHHSYGRDYDNWIRDRLGFREAAGITEKDVQDWVDWMKVYPSATGKPLSAKSIGDKHTILHQIFKWGSARTRGHVERNPCKETDLPKRSKKKPKGLRVPELMALLETGERIGDRDTADLVAFLAGTGWRISEAIALTAASIEDEGDKLFVSMDRVHRRMVGFTEGGKSEASEGRRLRVLGPAIGIVRRRMFDEDGKPKSPGDLMFTFQDGRPGASRTRPWNQTSFRGRRWKRLVEEAGLADRGPTPHWLRHTHVALCHAAGMSLAEIMRRVGHDDIQTTINIYGRMIDEMSDESAMKLDRLLTPRPAAEQVIQGIVVGELPNA